MPARAPRLLWPVAALLAISGASLLNHSELLFSPHGNSLPRPRLGPAAVAKLGGGGVGAVEGNASGALGGSRQADPRQAPPDAGAVGVGEAGAVEAKESELALGGSLQADLRQAAPDAGAVQAGASEAPSDAHANASAPGALPGWLLFGDSLPAPHRTRLAAWYSPACRGFYPGACRSGGSLTNATRASVPRACVSEDLYAGGRAAAYGTAPHVAQEVTMSDRHRFVYVEMRKAASSSVREWLLKAYGANWACPRSVACAERDKVVLYRCTSLCLTAWHLENYFFFTFVRDPVERFYSALKQAAVMRKRAGVSREEAEAALLGLRDAHKLWDVHLETQALAASTPTSRSDAHTVPLDFIGRVETLNEDQVLLQTLIAQHGRRPVPPKSVEMLREGARLNAGGRLGAAVDAVRDGRMDALAREAYAQDLACFPGG